MAKQYSWPVPRRDDDPHEWAKRLHIALTEYTDDQMYAGATTGGADHGGLVGLSDNDHTQYTLHSLADAASDFLVASGANTFVKKTLAETGAILETDINHDNLVGFVATEHVAEAAIDHGTIAGLGDDDHTQYTLHSLADATNDFLVASGADAFVKKTLAETGAILEADINHDNLVGFVGNEHIDWTDTASNFETTGTHITRDPKFDVRSYDAVGDGSNDDTTEVQAAITAANAAGGGTVFFPEGDWKLTSNLTGYSNVRLEGVGKSSKVNIAHTGIGITFNDKTGIHIQNLYFYGHGSGDGNVAIQLTYARQVWIQNCWFENFGRCGVKSDISGANRSAYLFITNNYFTDNMKDPPAGDWGHVQLFSSNHAVIQGNIIIDSSNGEQAGISVSKCNYCSIVGNSIDLGSQTNTMGIWVQGDNDTGGGPPAPENSNYCSVVGNTIRNIYAEGVAVRDSHKITVSGNSIYNCDFAGIAYYDSNRGTCTGNTIDGNSIVDHGIRIYGGESNVISSNTIVNPASYGISVVDSTTPDYANNNLIIGNHIYSSAADGIWLDTGVNDNMVIFNYITDSTGEDIDDDGTDTYIIDTSVANGATLAGKASVKKCDWIGAGSFRAPGTKPATFVSTGIKGAWEFANAGENNEEMVSGTWKIPCTMNMSVVPTFYIGWSAPGSSPGNCVWQFEYLWVTANDDTTAAAQETLTPTPTAASATANGLTLTGVTGIDAPGATDKAMFWRVTRKSFSVTDTIAAVVHMHGNYMEYTANKWGTAI